MSTTPTPPPSGKRLALLTLAALGIVYGDIGTSPLYAIRECFFGEYGIEVTPANVHGVLSLIFWSLIFVISLKYLTFIMRADNGGEGGILALLALISHDTDRPIVRKGLILGAALFGASLLYGDAMITPAISVLSAVEGLKVAAPAFEPFVLPLTVGILVGLFLFQHRGTGVIGAVFGPVTLLWFAVLAVLGVRGILLEPGVLAAVSPHHAVAFFLRNHVHGVLVLGAVFLVVTGGEAIYADMGHFGCRPIRLAWYTVVLPALLLNYFGQGGRILATPEAAHHPFYSLVPDWAHYPVVALATAATVIASQAVISGCFSLTRQAIQLGYCPRLKIRHTSSEEIGQIYIPFVNWVLMLGTIALVFGFRSSGKLAVAYGVAVTTTMLITTILFYVVARRRWGWGRLASGAPAAVFLMMDLSFFSANIVKISHGAWFPLLIGLGVFTLLSTWKRGREELGAHFLEQRVPLAVFLERLAADPPPRVPGHAVFMSGHPNAAPAALLHNIEHNHVLHEDVVILSVLTLDVPRATRKERLEITEHGSGVFQVIARYGFMEEPSVPRILASCKRRGLDLVMAETSFFLGRERVLVKKRSGMPAWRIRLFSFLSHNALGATAYYEIPPDRVVELGAQVEI